MPGGSGEGETSKALSKVAGLREHWIPRFPGQPLHESASSLPPSFPLSPSPLPSVSQEMWGMDPSHPHSSETSAAEPGSRGPS